MDDKTTQWLRQGPSWIRYAVEKQLLDESPDVQPVLRDPVMIEIIQRLKDPSRGLPAIPGGSMDADRYENPYWDLFFLADIGLSAADIGLKTEINRFLSMQSADGAYLTEIGMKPSYFCKSAIILSAITRMGYQKDPHIQKLVSLFLSSQRLDGGWYCNPDHDIGSPLQYEYSCPQENLNILLLLANYPELRVDTRFKGAIDLLLKHWEMRFQGVQIVYFGVGKRYQSLQYPAARYGILRVLDTLSFYPYAVRQSAFRNMLAFVQNKSHEGRYAAEISTPYTDLEQPEQANRLITFIINRVEKRVNDMV